ncbi:MAG TPA: N-6 DNA methylase [Candidatus Lokiarchaeia archaeon]|nr:N-6 DNA methylase [Candidatus Lokiarchaeia archaeon]
MTFDELASLDANATFNEVVSHLINVIKIHSKGILKFDSQLDLSGMWTGILGENPAVTRRDLLSTLQQGLLVLFAGMLLCNLSRQNSGVPGILETDTKTLTEHETLIPWFAGEITNAKQFFKLKILDTALHLLHSWPLDVNLAPLLEEFAAIASLCTEKPSLIVNDLLGRLFQEFNRKSVTKHLNMSFTARESAYILAGCAVNLQSLEQIKSSEESKRDSTPLSIIDPACGTGSLLLRIASFNDCYRIRGLDVHPLAVDLANASLAFLLHNSPDSQDWCQLMPFGGNSLGSLEILAGGYEEQNNYDVVLMNPPFSRSSGSNVAFGTLPQQEQEQLTQKMKQFRSQFEGRNPGAAGLAADFVVLADKLATFRGRIAVVLPISFLYGAGWTSIRQFLCQHYHIECIFIRTERYHFNFSEKTHLSECMIIGQKLEFCPDNCGLIAFHISELPPSELTLKDMLCKILLAIHEKENSPSNYDERQNYGEIQVGTEGRIAGTYTRIQQSLLGANPWSWGPFFRFAQPKLNSIICRQYADRLIFDSEIFDVPVKLRELNSLGDITYDRAAYRGVRANRHQKVPGNYEVISHNDKLSREEKYCIPAFWGRDNDMLHTFTVIQNADLRKLPNVSPALFAKHAGSRTNALLPETLRFNTSYVVSVFCEQAVISNVFWGFLPREDLQSADGVPITPDEISKITVLWTNTTPGILLLLSIADETDEMLFHWKKQTLAHALVPNVECFTRAQINQLCGLFDRNAHKEWGVVIQEQINTREKFQLDRDFLGICIGKQALKMISEQLEELYQSSQSLFYNS